jgi:PBP1b-binding outer membrane lipoprotein LpoB
MGDKILITILMRKKIAGCVIIFALFLSGCCGTLALHDPAAPASHHAQRKYDEAVRKGAIVPVEKGKDERK